MLMTVSIGISIGIGTIISISIGLFCSVGQREMVLEQSHKKYSYADCTCYIVISTLHVSLDDNCCRLR